MLKSFTITIYLVIGALVGLALFTLLFKRYDLPGKLRRRFKLYARWRIFGLLFLIGILIATLITLLTFAGLPEAAGQALEGLGIGFACVLVVGILNPADEPGKGGASSSKQSARRSADKKGRRSKG